MALMSLERPPCCTACTSRLQFRFRSAGHTVHFDFGPPPASVVTGSLTALHRTASNGGCPAVRKPFTLGGSPRRRRCVGHHERVLAHLGPR
ncbi:hypothetical protein V5799_023864 [Amblyomma americanum]|uniref:Uncharacterized protein n=1 Tax=Amblyomma americanum TaxID=6943 RepID=A0AAQ4FHZ6_AMBAM